MANKNLRATLEARIVDLEYQIKHGKLDPKIALTALMEETVERCISEINKGYFYSDEKWDDAFRDVIAHLTVKE